MTMTAADLARLLARTLEKMVRAEGQPPVQLSAECVRVLAETITAVEQRAVKRITDPSGFNASSRSAARSTPMEPSSPAFSPLQGT